MSNKFRCKAKFMELVSIMNDNDWPYYWNNEHRITFPLSNEEIIVSAYDSEEKIQSVIDDLFRR